MFGYPTGVGALVVRNDIAHLLQKSYIGGGTVAAISINPLYVSFKKELCQKFEDGTLPFQQIISLAHGFEYVESTLRGWEHYSDQCAMAKIVHWNGAPVVQMYQSKTNASGPIIAFNVTRSDGSYVGFSEVMRLANSEKIHLRSGRFCNPGAAQHYLQLTSSEIREFRELLGHVCGDQQDIVDSKPTGCLRISFGFATTAADIRLWDSFLRHYFVETSPQTEPSPATGLVQTELRLDSMYLYPIKSCGGIEVTGWPIRPCGLLYDRSLMLVDSDHKPLTLKRLSKMNLISVKDIDWQTQTLVVSAPSMQDHTIALDQFHTVAKSSAACGAVSVSGLSSAAATNHWFSTFLGIAARLVQCEEGKSFSNTSPFMMIAAASLQALKDSIPQNADRDHVTTLSFRPNFVVSHTEPFTEESLIGKVVCFGGLQFFATALCERCSVIGVDQQGVRHREPLRTLAKSPRPHRKIVFGLHLRTHFKFTQNKVKWIRKDGA
ncbi:hypothetical protein HDU91_005556 [Kappamyces sp. JEL0680]|nr:hypothetical protein HDU91_005556 [Kappamyces sp. JEL0680]